METGDADVVETNDRVAHDLRGHSGFLRDREVRRAGAGNQHRTSATLDAPLDQGDGARMHVIHGAGNYILHRLEGVRLRASDQQAMPALHDALSNGGDLGRSFAYT